MNINPKLLKFGNMKIPTSTAIFDLPAVTTCPGSTPECRKHCYARKAERCYPSVLPFRQKNFTVTRTQEFTQEIQKELATKKKVDVVRIHSSGDFYNQRYYDKWVEITKMFPGLTFYAYTKNTKLDISKRPKNFIMLLSDDQQVYKDQWYKYNGVATVTPRKQQPDPNFTVCPGSCKSCTLCHSVIKDNRITFLEH